MAIKPPILMPGDTIGVVTLGSPLEKSVIDARIEVLKHMGFQVIIGNFVYAADGFLAGTDQQRAFDLMQMFDRPEVKLILPTRGGVGVAGILPFLDFQFIQQHPKIISGYSDVTVLLNTLYEYANLITFQSLMLIDFNLGMPKYNFDQFFAAVSTTPATRIIENPPEMPLQSIIPGSVTGDIVGGNLTSFVDTIGTPFEIDTKGKILLIEETHEPINTVYRYLNRLKLAGKFDDCIGIIMGQCTECAAAYGKTYDDLINDFIVPLNKPLMTNLATAHGTYKAAVPIGASVNLDTVNNTLTVLEPTVSV
jgi:muramoyltetrapeptide carboxypeptidase